VLYKFGVAVLFGLSPLEEDDVLSQVGAPLAGAVSRRDDETLMLELLAEGEGNPPPTGTLSVKDATGPRLLVIANALAKSVLWARRNGGLMRYSTL